MISYNFVYRNMLVRRTGNICKIYDGHKLLIDLCYRKDEYIKIWIDGYLAYMTECRQKVKELLFKPYLSS